jgi:A/G-specific adenine glycosylase
MVAAPFFAKANVKKFRKRLLRWFGREKRALPWRGESDPYRILVSEIMLQQTRVAVVEERYRTFLRQFPTVKRLAGAREQTVLAAWSGLGYYRRARSLHASARLIARASSFPQTSADLRGLPGVGRYTANAVASIAFCEPVPVVDGNVKRVLQRMLARGLTDDQCWQAAGELLEKRRPGDFNQALMELGALLCLPGKPLCKNCPVAALCSSRGAGAARKQSPRRKAVLNYALARRNGHVLLHQRPHSSSLMPGMWELPECRKELSRRKPLLQVKHSITVTDYAVRVFADKQSPAADGRWVPLRRVERLALTGLARKILRAYSRLNATIKSERSRAPRGS